MAKLELFFGILIGIYYYLFIENSYLASSIKGAEFAMVLAGFFAFIGLLWFLLVAAFRLLGWTVGWAFLGPIGALFGLTVGSMINIFMFLKWFINALLTVGAFYLIWTALSATGFELNTTLIAGIGLLILNLIYGSMKGDDCCKNQKKRNEDVVIDV